MTRTLFLLLVLSTSACVSVPPSVTVQFDDPARLRFQGKGAGAGVMLMSSMGPAGIAIGIAIDEGIGKDIDKAATDKGLDVQHALLDIVRENVPSSVKAITVHRYGYIARGARDDHVVPELQLTLHYHDGTTAQVNYPNDVAQNVVPRYALEPLKLDGALVVHGLQRAMEVALALE